MPSIRIHWPGGPVANDGKRTYVEISKVPRRYPPDGQDLDRAQGSASLEY